MRKFFLTGLVLWALNVQAQESSLLFHWGISTYSMKDQKSLQKDFKSMNSAIPLRSVHTFPAYYNFGGSLALKTSVRSAVGLWYEYNSTAGRLHYKDYSGYMLFDQVLRSSQVGVFGQYTLVTNKDWSLLATSHLSLVFTQEDLTYAVQVGLESYEEKYTFKSRHFGIRPGVLVQRKISMLLLQAGLGVEIQTSGQLNTTDDLLLTDSNGDPITAQWDGLRLTLGVGLLLKK